MLSFRHLMWVVSAASLALVVSCSGEDADVYKKIEMPAAVNIEPGVYAVGYEKLPNSNHRTMGVWRDGEPFDFYDEDGRLRDWDDQDHYVNAIIDFCVTPGYIYVLAVVNNSTSLWVNGHKVLEARIERDEWGQLLSSESFMGIDAEGDEWYLAGFVHPHQPGSSSFPSVLWTKDYRREVDARLRARDVLLVDGAIFIVGNDGSNNRDPRYIAYWVDGAMHYLDGGPAFESLGWNPGYSDSRSSHGYIWGEKICVSGGNVYVAGTIWDDDGMSWDDGGMGLRGRVVLWENDAPPKVLKEMGGYISRPASILVEDGDVYVFGVESDFWIEHCEYNGYTWDRRHDIFRDLMWKNGGDPVLLNEIVHTGGADDIAKSGEDGVAAFVSGGDRYTAKGGAVLKNDQPIFTLRPKSAGAACTVDRIFVVK